MLVVPCIYKRPWCRALSLGLFLVQAVGSLIVYTCITLLSAGSHSVCVCVNGVVGVNSLNSLQRKSNGLAKTEYVNY